MKEIYSNLALYYDRLMEDIDYKSWAKFYDSLLKKYGNIENRKIIDIGCGSGSISIPLSKMNYEIFGLDISSEMLSFADMKARKNKVKNINFLHADMCDFDLGLDASMVICSFDGINYLLDTKKVLSCFKNVYNNLEENGIFVFDISTKYKYENILSDNVYVYDLDDLFVTWQNFYNEKTGICDFVLSFFNETSSGLYKKSVEYQRQRKYSEKTILRLLKEANFSIIDTYSDIDFSKYTNTSEREFFVCKRNG